MNLMIICFWCRRCGDHPRETTQCCAESIISCCRDSEQCLHNHPENGLDQCLVDEEFMDQGILLPQLMHRNADALISHWLCVCGFR